jgi:hypothetical protein
MILGITVMAMVILIMVDIMAGAIHIMAAGAEVTSLAEVSQVLEIILMVVVSIQILVAMALLKAVSAVHAAVLPLEEIHAQSL